MQGDLGVLLRGSFRGDEADPDGEAQAAPPLAAAPPLDETPRKADAAPGGTRPRMRLSGDRMSGARRAWATAQHLYRVGRRRFNDARAQEGGIVGSALRWQGPSVEDQSAYATGRAWVPRGFAAGTLEAMGVIFHAALGRPAVAIGNGIKWVFCRPIHCVPGLIAATGAWWALHGMLGLPGGALPLIVTLIVIGAWIVASAGLNLMWEHQMSQPSRYGQPVEDGERADADDWPDDEEDYIR